jgi:apolipoprotein N-acyltransferase
VENRRYFVRCSSTGISCVIAPTGQIVAQAPPQSEETLRSEIALLRGRTLYNRVGDVFPVICTILALAGICFCRPFLAVLEWTRLVHSKKTFCTT